MKKRNLIALLLVLIISLVPVGALASPETLPAGYAGNTDSLIDIKNPDSAVSSTTSKVCVVSAVAVSGTTVTLYNYDSSKGQYVKMYAGGKALEASVGAAGLFAQNVELKSGTNTILVVDTSGNYVETVKLDITVVKSEVAENIINIWQTLIK